MTLKRTYRVSEVAVCSGVSVRALHYYEQIGLLVPKRRTDAGYRLYDDQDLLRLQQISIGRAQGLALEEIRRSLDDPNFDRKRALLAQRRQLEQSMERTTEMMAAIDAALEMLENGLEDTMDMKRIFNGFDPAEHEAEAKAKWGNSDAYLESAQRTKRYTAADWQEIQSEQAAIYAEAFALLQAASAADSMAAMDVAERHRLSIDRWFYPCSVAMHVTLADMYEADRRFADNIDKFGVGLMPFLAAAIRANAAHSSREPVARV